MAKTEERKLRRRIAVVEYEDGRTEELNVDKPLWEYQTYRLGIDPATDQTEAGFFELWFASGKPGANGHELTLDMARPLVEAWLETVKTWTIRIEESAPPTRRGTSRTSAG